MVIVDAKVARLAKAAEAHSERESESSVRRPQSVPLEKSLSGAIVQYLLSPYENGFWELRASWNPASALAKYLLGKLGTLTDVEKEIDGTGFMPNATARKLSDEKRE